MVWASRPVNLRVCMARAASWTRSPPTFPVTRRGGGDEADEAVPGPGGHGPVDPAERQVGHPAAGVRPGRLGLGEPDATHLGRGERGPGQDPIVEPEGPQPGRAPQGVAGRHPPHAAGGAGELGPADHVPAAQMPFTAVAMVSTTTTAPPSVDVHAELLEAQAMAGGRPTDGHQHPGGGDGCRCRGGITEVPPSTWQDRAPGKPDGLGPIPPCRREQLGARTVSGNAPHAAAGSGSARRRDRG